jgi:predicted enzyme related to lactoylglutathione lyase
VLKYNRAFITIAARNLSSLVEFYSRLLQQQPDPYLPNIYAEFSIDSLKLGIFAPKESQKREFIASKLSSYSICLTVENLEESIAYLQSIDYPNQPEISTASHGKEAYIFDPEGNRLILYQPFNSKQ